MAAAAAPVAVPNAEVRQVSVLFVDLVGYTAFSETRDAEDVRTLLSSYFDTARTIVGRYGGRVEKFIGDAVMAVWGSPVALEDDAERAVRAALELVAQVPVFGEEAGVPALQARGGVVTGHAASIANPAEGLVVGDRVNTASRVQSAAEPGTVLVDDVTRALTEESLAYEDAGEHTAKGKADPLHLWRALRVVAGIRGSQRRGDGLEPAFVGRDTEFALVKAMLHDTVDRGTARLVTVVGEAGVGKSRLVWEFEKYTDGIAGTLLWHVGRCPRYGDGVAYWALAEVVRARFGIADDDPATSSRPRWPTGWRATSTTRWSVTSSSPASVGLSAWTTAKASRATSSSPGGGCCSRGSRRRRPWWWSSRTRSGLTAGCWTSWSTCSSGRRSSRCSS